MADVVLPSIACDDDAPDMFDMANVESIANVENGYAHCSTSLHTHNVWMEDIPNKNSSHTHTHTHTHNATMQREEDQDTTKYVEIWSLTFHQKLH